MAEVVKGLELCRTFSSTRPSPSWIRLLRAWCMGTAFRRLDIDVRIKSSIASALGADSLKVREDSLTEAQALVGDLHNQKRHHSSHSIQN